MPGDRGLRASRLPPANLLSPLRGEDEDHHLTRIAGRTYDSKEFHRPQEG